jgi:predicted acetyltransferase
MVEVVTVDVDDPRFARLLQLYLHEWSGLLPLPIGDDATYVHPDLHRYRGDDGHASWLFVDGTTPVGFSLVRREPDGCWRVMDFFVIAGARRRGAGRRAAADLFATRPGRWTLTVRPENPRALAFWRNVDGGVGEQIETGNDGIERTRLWYAPPPSCS